MKKYGIFSIVLCIVLCLTVLGRSVSAYAAANSTDVTDAEVLAKFAEDASTAEGFGGTMQKNDLEV